MMQNKYGILIILLVSVFSGCSSSLKTLDLQKFYNDPKLPYESYTYYGEPYAVEHFIRAKVLFNRGGISNIFKAVDEQKKAVTADGSDWYLRVTLAKMQMAVKLYNQADHQLSKALLFAPGSSAVWIAIAGLYLKTENKSMALKTALHALSIDSTDKETLSWLGSFYIKSNPRKSLDYYTMAYENSGFGRFALTCAEIAAGLKDKSAIKYLTEYVNSPDVSFKNNSKNKNNSDYDMHIISLAGEISEYIDDDNFLINLTEKVIELEDGNDKLRMSLVQMMLKKHMYKNAMTQILRLGEPEKDQISKISWWMCQCGSCYEGLKFFTGRLGYDPAVEADRFILSRIALHLEQKELAFFLLNNPKVAWSDKYRQKIDIIFEKYRHTLF